MKRIWYIPGAISLVLLLPLCLAYMERKHVFTEYRSITLAYPPIVTPVDTSWLDFKWEEPEREWQELQCDGPLSNAEKAIEEFSKISRGITSAQDTTHGVRLNFGTRTKWNTVIAAVDAALADSTLTFWLNESSIRTCWIPPAPAIPVDTVTIPAFTCDIIPLCGTVSMPFSRSERIMASLGPILDGIAKYWSLTILFLALTMLSAVKLQRDAR